MSKHVRIYVVSENAYATGIPHDDSQCGCIGPAVPCDERGEPEPQALAEILSELFPDEEKS